jgi:uncharacterized Zn finger protein (UPF0148 family)
MTGKHCDTCGDPIFRYDGTEFCPTCQHETGEVSDDAAGASDDATADDPETAAETEIEVETGAESESEQAQNPSTGDPAKEPTPRSPPSQSTSAGQPTPSNRSNPSNPQNQSSQSSQSGQPNRASQPTHSNQSGRRDSGSTATRPADGDLAEARSALVRKLTRLAHEAEQTEDVARARNLLSATREAAEALAALDRANR